jgi:hypothetical protein
LRPSHVQRWIRCRYPSLLQFLDIHHRHSHWHQDI